MAILEELDVIRINDVIATAAQKCTPATLTVSRGCHWINLRSRIVALKDAHLWLELPIGQDGTQYEFAPAEKVGVSFKLRHHKHIFYATVQHMEQMPLDAGGTVPVLSVCCPTKMQRLQRRAYARVDVPAGKIVRASFWLGGQQQEPSGTSTEQPVWTGAVLNLSAGGFLMRVDSGVADALDEGDTVGVRLSFGPGQETIYTDAQFRHADVEGDEAMMGFQFVGLSETAAGRETLSLITTKLKQFEHMAAKTASRR